MEHRQVIIATSNGNFMMSMANLTSPGATPVFTKALTGTSVEVLAAEHGLSVVKGLRVINSEGDAVEVLENYDGTTVRLESNTSLINHTLILY